MFILGYNYRQDIFSCQYFIIEVLTMRTKLNITEGIFPMPVLMVATYNDDGSVNVMTAAWGTIMPMERSFS